MGGEAEGKMLEMRFFEELNSEEMMYIITEVKLR